MPQKEIVETFTHEDREYHIMGRDGRYYVRDDTSTDQGPFASIEEAKATVTDPDAGKGAPVDPGEPDAA
jgi:hypothetical protein